MARTTQSVVVVCEIQPGNFYYRGVRLSDGASIELANAVRSWRIRRNKSVGRDPLPNSGDESYHRAARWTGVLRADAAIRIQLAIGRRLPRLNS